MPTISWNTRSGSDVYAICGQIDYVWTTTNTNVVTEYQAASNLGQTPTIIHISTSDQTLVQDDISVDFTGTIQL